MADEVIENLAAAEKGVAESVDAMIEKLPDCMKKLHRDWEALQTAWADWNELMNVTYKKSSSGTSKYVEKYNFKVEWFPFNKMTSWLSSGMANLTAQMGKMPSASDVAGLEDLPSGQINSYWDTIKAANHYSAFDYLNIAMRNTSDYTWNCKGTLAGELQPKPTINTSQLGKQVANSGGANSYYIYKPATITADYSDVGFTYGSDFLGTHPHMWWEDPVMKLSVSEAGGGTALTQTLTEQVKTDGWTNRTKYSCDVLNSVKTAGGYVRHKFTSTDKEGGGKCQTGMSKKWDFTRHKTGACHNVAQNHHTSENVKNPTHAQFSTIHFWTTWLGTFFSSEGAYKKLTEESSYYANSDLGSDNTYISLAGISMWENSWILPAFLIGNFNKMEPLYFFCSNEKHEQMYNSFSTRYRMVEEYGNCNNYLPTSFYKRSGPVWTEYDANANSRGLTYLTGGQDWLKSGYTYTGHDGDGGLGSSGGVYNANRVEFDHGYTAFKDKPYDGFVFGKHAQWFNRDTGQFESGGKWTTSPLEDLVKIYFQLKKAFWDMRDSVGCILNLDVDILESKSDLALVADDVVNDPKATSDQKEKAREALKNLKETDDVARLSSTFNKNLIFREQCFLMAYLPNLSKYHKTISAAGIAGKPTEITVAKAAITAKVTDEAFALIAEVDEELALVASDLSVGPTYVDVADEYLGTGAGAAAIAQNPALVDDVMGNVLEMTLGEGTVDKLKSFGVPVEIEYLGTMAEDIVEKENIIHRKPLPTSDSNASILLDSKSPYAFMNALAVGGTQTFLHNLSVDEISNLQPMISLYKIEFDPETNEEVPIKLVFDSFANTKTPQPVETLLQNKDKRGFGTGIQSFNFTYAGSNPFAVKKSIKAELKIFSNSFDELLQMRDNKYRYVDLALKTSNTGVDSACIDTHLNLQNENMAKLNFRLRAIVGWQLPAGQKSSNFSSNLTKAIEDSFVTLNLVPTVHDFDFDDMGRVVFTINYLAYIDEFMDQNEFDIFSGNHEVKISQTERRLSYNKLKKACKKDKIKLLKEKNISAIDDEKKLLVSSLMKGLIEQDKVYYINQDYDEIRDFAAAGPFFSAASTAQVMTNEELNQSLGTSIDSALQKYSTINAEDSLDKVRVGLMAVDPNQVSIPFFYVSDLLDYILQTLSKSLREIGNKLSAKVGVSPIDVKEYISDKEEALEKAKETLKSQQLAAAAAEVIPENPLASVSTPDLGLSDLTLSALPGSFDQSLLPEELRFPEYESSLDSAADSLTTSTPATEKFNIALAGHTKAKIEEKEKELETLKTREGAAELAIARQKASGGVGEGFDPCEMMEEAVKYKRLAKEFSKFRLVLGPVEIFDVKNDISAHTINIGDFPISVKYFVEFLTEKLAKKQESTYSIANFCNDFFNNLIRNFLNDDSCFTGVNSSLKVSLNAASVTAYSTDSTSDTITQLARKIDARRFTIDQIKSSSRRILNTSGNRDSDTAAKFASEFNYLMFFAGRTKPTTDMKGNKSSDSAKGIMHYELGRDRGIVKNIKLTKTQTPGLQEVRFEQDGYDGLRQLRVVYDVNIDTYADVHAYPGTYIFVNPITFAPTSNLTPCDPMNLTEYGIGGYYMIVSSEHQFAPGTANTKIFAKWVNEISGTGPKCSELAGGKRLRKCKAGADPLRGG